MTTLFDYREHCVCPSDRREPILSNGGQKLGEMCKACLRVCRWAGVCSFCEAAVDNLVYRGSRAFCSDDCSKRELVARRAKRLEEARAEKAAELAATAALSKVA